MRLYLTQEIKIPTFYRLTAIALFTLAACLLAAAIACLATAILCPVALHGPVCDTVAWQMSGCAMVAFIAAFFFAGIAAEVLAEVLP